MIALTEFAHAIGAGRGQQILLVLDSAGWHVSPQVQAPAGIHLHFLPPYSPELQPAQRLWPLTHEALANRHVRDLEELQYQDLVSHRPNQGASHARQPVPRLPSDELLSLWMK